MHENAIADEGIPEAGLTTCFDEINAFISENAAACQ